MKQDKVKSGVLLLVLVTGFSAAYIAAFADEHHNPALNSIKAFFTLSGSEYYISERSKR